MNTAEEKREYLIQLERKYAEIEASLPAHSLPSTMLIRLEELEDEIAAITKQLDISVEDKPSL